MRGVTTFILVMIAVLCLLSGCCEETSYYHESPLDNCESGNCDAHYRWRIVDNVSNEGNIAQKVRYEIDYGDNEDSSYPNGSAEMGLLIEGGVNGISVDDAMDTLIAGYHDAFDNFKVESKQSISLNGILGSMVIYTGVHEEFDADYMGTEVILIREADDCEDSASQIRLYYGCLNRNFGEYEQEGMDFIESFRIIKK